MKKIKLFFDASPILHGLSGIPVYTQMVVRNLAARPELELHSGLIASSRAVHRKYRNMLEELTASRIQYHPIFFPGRWGGKLPGVSFPARKYDLIHYAAHVAPAYCAPSDFANTILTVHDMFLWHREYRLDDAAGMNLIEKNLPHQAEKARAIVTVSEFSRQEIHKYLGIPLEKIHAVPIAAQWGDKAFPPSTVLPENALTPKSYFLSVSTLLPHKNFVSLFTAFRKYRQSSDYAGEKLVVVGKRMEQFPEICRALEETPDVIHLENIPENDLRTLYENSKGFFLVSKLEGFGIPLLEAMSCQIPACYGKGSSMDEIGRDAAYGVEPEDVDKIAEMFAVFSAGGAEVERRTALAYRVSCEYSYAKTVETYAALYRLLLR